MSATSRKQYNHDIVAGNPGSDLLSRWGFADMPATPQAREVGYNATTNRLQVRANGVTQDIAWLADLNSFGRYRGTWDASTGIPTVAGSTAANGDTAEGTAIRAGDKWLVRTAGTIAGIGAGAAALQVGDLIMATAAAANTAAQFAALEQNSATAPATGFVEQTLASLPADTATTATITGMTTVRVVAVRNGVVDITSQLVVEVPAANQVRLTSSVALSNLTIICGGVI